jgi:PGF-CTERM protein
MRTKVIGIAVALVILASFAAMAPTVSATDATSSSTGANANGYIVNPGVLVINVTPGSLDTVRIGQEILFINNTVAQGSNESAYSNCEVTISGIADTATEGVAESTTTVRNVTVGNGATIDSANLVGLYFDTKNWPAGKTGVCDVAFKKGGTTVSTQQITVSATGTLSLDFKVGTKSISSVALGTSFLIDTGSPPLGSNDEVDIVVTQPNGQQLKSEHTTTPGQNFTLINASRLSQYAATGVDTTNWKVGEYTIEVKSKEEHARGLAVTSGSKTLTVVKGEVDITAETTSVNELATVKLTVTGVPGRLITVRAFPLNSNVEFAVGVNDNPNTAVTDHFNHTIDADSVRTYAVKFTDTGSYTIKVLDFGGNATFEGTYTTTVTPGVPAIAAGDDSEATVDISVAEKAITFDIPASAVIGQKLTIKGTANTGTYVTVAVDGWVYSDLDRLVIDSNKQFSKEIDTSSSTGAGAAFRTPGSVRLKAYIDRAKAASYPNPIGTAETDDGSVAILMSRGDLTAELSTPVVAQDDDFTISGTAKGTKSVDIVIVSPKGAGGTKIDGAGKAALTLCPEKGQVGIYMATASVSETDFTFTKKISVGEDVDTGTYAILALSPGSDGLYGKAGFDSLELALCEYTIGGRTQSELWAIIEDIADPKLSDDLPYFLYVKVEAAYVRLDPLKSVGVGEPLVVTGTSNRKEGFAIVVTAKGPKELTPQTVKVAEGKFSATFDTTDAPVGTYSVKADDGDGHTDEATVEIVTAVPTAPPTVAPTVAPTATPTMPPTATPAATPTPTPTPTPEEPGFEAVLAIAGLLAIAYLIHRKK